MTKSFLTYTAIIEGLTGLALILVPARTALLLFKAEPDSPVDIILAMVAGAAIFSLALGVWLARLREDTGVPLKILLYYNGAVALILLYGALALGLGGVVLWIVIVFHFFQTAVCFQIIQKKPVNQSFVDKV